MRISDWSSDVCSSELDTGFRARPVRHRRVRHRCRMRDQALDAAQRFGEGEALQAVEERAHGRLPRSGTVAAEFDRKHRAEALLLRSEEHTSELQSLMRISYAVFCLHKNRYAG